MLEDTLESARSQETLLLRGGNYLISNTDVADVQLQHLVGQFEDSTVRCNYRASNGTEMNTQILIHVQWAHVFH